MSAEDVPRYRIQTVSEMTGIPAPTLRAWERRYGVPTPNRTGKGYRLFSARDVEMLARMRDLCESGMSASDAARLVGDFFSPADEPAPTPGDPAATVSRRIVSAVERFDADGLDREIRLAQTMGSAAVIFEDIFAPALREIGDRWHEGTLSVSQEHLASEALARATRNLLDLVQPTSAPRSAVLACWEEEQHVMPLYGIAFRLAQWGYRCVVLGARTPPEAVAEAVDRLAPDVVGLSLTLAPPEAMLAEQARAYATAAGTARVIVGGLGAQASQAVLEAAGLRVSTGDIEALRRELATSAAG
ncbi:MerR family transcriptional regulator [Myxococcota bacterium]|nr:MerR family transcriptional regulator [Myxococcota bacterium]